jgi:adenosine deaminase
MLSMTHLKIENPIFNIVYLEVENRFANQQIYMLLCPMSNIGLVCHFRTPTIDNSQESLDLHTKLYLRL